MKLFVDTEFNGHGGELISMAVVTDDNRHWYQVRTIPIKLHPWVAEHVIPLLGQKPIEDAMFRRSFHAFMRHMAGATVIADWPSDLMFFFDTLLDVVPGAALGVSLRAELVPDSDCHPVTPHNALSDAYALRDWYMRVNP